MSNDSTPRQPDAAKARRASQLLGAIDRDGDTKVTRLASELSADAANLAAELESEDGRTEGGEHDTIDL